MSFIPLQGLHFNTMYKQFPAHYNFFGHVTEETASFTSGRHPYLKVTLLSIHRAWLDFNWELRWSFDFLLVPDAPAPPSIWFNSNLVPNQTQKALTAGSTIKLSCSGSSPVFWNTTALNLKHKKKLGNPLGMNRSEPRHTGTYTCGYANQSLSHLNVWIHLYVNGRINWDHASSANYELWLGLAFGTATF